MRPSRRAFGTQRLPNAAKPPLKRFEISTELGCQCGGTFSGPTQRSITQHEDGARGFTYAPMFF
jgi:hypothetical protein